MSSDAVITVIDHWLLSLTQPLRGAGDEVEALPFKVNLEEGVGGNATQVVTVNTAFFSHSTTERGAHLKSSLLLDCHYLSGLGYSNLRDCC